MHRIRDLTDSGASPSELNDIRRKMSHLTWGVYVDKGLEPLEKYRQRCREVQARLKPGATLAGTSAAVMWDLPLLHDPPEHVYISNITRGRYSKEIHVLPPAPAVLHGGDLLSSPSATVAQCARIVDSRQALVMADAALAQELCTLQDLVEAAEAMRGRPGASRVRWVAAHADPLAESPGETWARMVALQLGYHVISQFHVTAGPREAFLDLLVADTMVGIEFDGLEKYKKRGVGKVIQEHLREGDLQAIGYRLVRLIWQQLDNAEQFDKRLRAAGARPVRTRRFLTW